MTEQFTREEIIQRSVLAALMHVKPDYRSPKRLDAAAGVIATFVERDLAEDDKERARRIVCIFGRNPGL
jgi:hypothetical protein